jgi:hypothetical protein
VGVARHVQAALTLAAVLASSSAEGGELDLTGPAQMILGVDATAEISAVDPDGKPVQMFVNVGGLSDVRSVDGRVRATYTPPATRFPQVAVVAAVSEDGLVVDWLAIPLHARPKFTIASERNTEVVVRVEEAEFGPIKTDRKGGARLEIEVPPGVTDVVVVARDKLGNEKATTHSLGVPEFDRMTVVCPRGGDQLLIFAVDATGQPDGNARFDLAASPGALEPAVMEAPGRYSAVFVVGDEVAAAEESDLSVTLRGSASSSTCRAPIPRELPTGVSVAFEPASFVAGSGVPVAVTIDVAYPGRRLPRLVAPSVEVDLGTISELEMVSHEQFRATWTVSDEFGGKTAATLRVRTTVASALDGRSTIALRAGAVARLEVNADREGLRADGHATAQVRVAGIDEFGNPVQAMQLSTRAGGRVGAFVSDGDTLVATYTAPVRYERDVDRISVVDSSSGVEASLSVELHPIARRFMASVRLGYLTNLGMVSSAVAAADVALRLPFSSRQLSAGVETGYYASTNVQPRDDGAEDVEVAVRAVPLLARIIYDIELESVAVYGGVGAGVLFAWRRIESASTGMRATSGPRPTATAIVGVRVELGPGLAIVEGAYWYSPISDDALEGNIGGLRLTGGYGLDF